MRSSNNNNTTRVKSVVWSTGAVLLAFAVFVLTSGCNGGGSRFSTNVSSVSNSNGCDPDATCDPSDPTTPTGDPPLGPPNPPPVYENGDTLILSADNLDVLFVPGQNIVTATLSTTSAEQDNRLLFWSIDSSLVLSGEASAIYGVGENNGRFPIWYTAQNHLYCHSNPCGDDYSDASRAYEYRIRYEETIARDVDVVHADLMVMKTTRSADHLAYGVVATLNYHSQQTTTTVVVSRSYDVATDTTSTTTTTMTTTLNVYRPEQKGGFVSGPRYDMQANSLPVTGLAAYVGFANAYASSSNRNFMPFNVLPQTRGSYFAVGYSAMVFGFDSDGASFEHGFISLDGIGRPDNGGRRGVPNFVTHSVAVTNSLILNLAGNFASPEYLDDTFASRRYGVDASDYGQVAGFVGHPSGEVELGPDPRQGFFSISGLAFRLSANPYTSGDDLDFIMDLVSVTLEPERKLAGQNIPDCYPANPNVICYASTSSPRGAGEMRLYGSPVTMSVNDAVDGAPTFAAGVWQYNQIVYVDTKADGPGGGNDELLGVVDLVGSLGGHIYDAAPE